MEIKKMLEDEIEREFTAISYLEDGSDAQSKMIENLNTMYKLNIEEKKIEQESKFKKDEIQSQKIDRYIKIGASGVAFFGTIISYNYWFKEGLRFEKDGTICSSFVKDLMKNIKPFRMFGK